MTVRRWGRGAAREGKVHMWGKFKKYFKQWLILLFWGPTGGWQLNAPMRCRHLLSLVFQVKYGVKLWECFYATLTLKEQEEGSTWSGCKLSARARFLGGSSILDTQGSTYGQWCSLSYTAWLHHGARSENDSLQAIIVQYTLDLQWWAIWPPINISAETDPPK